jgi:hypothetical protein
MDVRDEQRTRFGEAPLGLLHSGSRYSFGFGEDFYGIWDAVSPDAPVERFSPTPEGRGQGIARYVEMEPSAEAALIPKPVEAEDEEAGLSRRRWIIAGGVLAVAAAVVVGLVLSRGGGEEQGSEALGPVGTTAHVETTGAFTITEDLEQSNVEISGVDSLYPRVRVSWAGTQFRELAVIMNTPEIGSVKTNELANQRLGMTLNVSGLGEVILESSHGECTIIVDRLEEGAFSGSFTCAGLVLPGSESTIDMEGTFAAST